MKLCYLCIFMSSGIYVSLGVDDMPSGGYRIKCRVCGQDQYQSNIARHMFRAHRIGNRRPSFSTSTSSSTTRDHSPESAMDRSALEPTSLPATVPVRVSVNLPSCSYGTAACGMSSTVSLSDLVPDRESVESRQVKTVVVGDECVTPQQSQSLITDHRKVVSRVQQVSYVRVSDDGSNGNAQPSVVNSNVGDGLLQTHCVTSDALAGIIRDAVLCMLRRDDNNNLIALRKYLSLRFPEIPEMYRDPIIISTFAAAQKAALTYFDTLHTDAVDRNAWSRNYLHKWSHGLNTCEPPPKYIPSKKQSFESENAEKYSPATNFMLTREFPVSLYSQRKEFDRATEQIMAHAQSSVGVGMSHTDEHPVTETLVSVAKSLLNLPSEDIATGSLGDEGHPPQSVLPMEGVTTAPSQSNVSGCSDSANGIPSMPDLSEFMPTVVDGKVLPADSNGMYDVEPMEQGTVCDSPKVDTFVDLLKVNDANCLILDDLTKPLLDLVTPITSPENKRSDVDEQGQVSETSDSSLSQVTTVKVNENPGVVKHAEFEQGRLRDTKSPKKPKINKPVKENVKPQSAVVDVTSTGKKSGTDAKKKGSVSRGERDEMIRRRKRVEDVRRDHRYDADEGMQNQRIPEFKIPFRPRQDDFYRPMERFRRDETRFGRCVGLGRGFRTLDMCRFDDRPRPRPMPCVNRSKRVPGLTPEEQRWLDKMPVMWSER